MTSRELLRNHRIQKFRDALRHNSMFRMRLLNQQHNYAYDNSYIQHALGACSIIASHYKLHLRRELECWRPKKSPLAHMKEAYNHVR